MCAPASEGVRHASFEFVAMAAEPDAADDGELETLYDVLHCAPAASDTELRVAYKQQALHWHPDKNDDPDAEERFKKINHAWSVLSDESRRAAYDHSLQCGTAPSDFSGMHGGTGYDGAAAASRAAWQAFMRAEELERLAQRRRERSLLVGTVGFALWMVVVLVGISAFAPALPRAVSTLLLPPPLELSNSELARYPLNMDFQTFQDKLRARVRHGEHSSLLSRLRVPQIVRDALLRSHTPYLRVTFNHTSELRRAPDVGRPSGRGWLLMSSHKAEDIYGRPVDIVANTLLYMPEAKPRPWPPTTLCVRLLVSGPVKQKVWWHDLSRATGGRLRSFALAVVASSECAPEYGLLALLVSTVLALTASSMTVRAVLGPRPRTGF